uniref:Uncharacterized protein n=1 Tax=viral metagenome TaxID=1070528 RepID=A0A6H2A468_9ZZZZ
MNCPKCGKYLERRFPPDITIDNFQEYQDVDFECENEHIYFVRIKPEDLIEAIS